MQKRQKILLSCLLIFLTALSLGKSQNMDTEKVMEVDYTYCASDLSRLILRDRFLSSEMLSFIDEFETKVKEIKRLLLEDDGNILEKEMVDNPLLSYNVIRKKVETGPQLEKYFEDLFSLFKKSENIYRELMQDVAPPTNFDMIESMESIIRLRHTYSLDVEQLAKGDLGSLGKINGILSSSDLFDIGSHGLEIGMFTDAIDYLEVVYQLETNDTTRDIIKVRLIDAVSKHDENFQLYKIHPNESDPEEIMNLFDRQLGDISSEEFRNRKTVHNNFREETIVLNKQLETIINFEKLCRNENLKSAAERSQLKCYLASPSNHAFWTLCPLKIEIHHESPRIIQIYEILTETEIDKIITKARSSLKRSKLYRIDENGTLVSGTNRIRTSSNTWILDKELEEFHFINEKIARITGYSVSGTLSSEDLQIASYRGGGHYSLHTDGLFEDKIIHTYEPLQFDMGDRIATFMIYLSEVTLGGNTVFPLLQVGVKPVKNSAILWENLNLDGSINLKTLHGGCPVLFGVKEVANKWIRSNDQMFTANNCRCPPF